eukprot:772838-Prymnesium_polylepis.1
MYLLLRSGAAAGAAPCAGGEGGGDGGASDDASSTSMRGCGDRLRSSCTCITSASPCGCSDGGCSSLSPSCCAVAGRGRTKSSPPVSTVLSSAGAPPSAGA